MNRPLFEISVDAKLLIDFLREIPEGDRATYSAMTKLLGRDVREEAKSALRTAFSHLVKEDQIHFEVIPNIGYVRLSDDEVARRAGTVAQKVSRFARREVKKLVVQDFDKLNNDAKGKILLAQSFLGMVAHASKPAQQKKLAAKIGNNGAPLSLMSTLKALSDKDDKDDK